MEGRYFLWVAPSPKCLEWRKTLSCFVGWAFPSWILLALRGKLGVLCPEVGNGFSSKLQHGGNTALGYVGLAWGGLKPGKGEIIACRRREKWADWMSGANHWGEGSSRQVSVFNSQLQCHCSRASGSCSWETSLFSKLQRLDSTYQGLNNVCSSLINAICKTLLWKKVQQGMRDSITMGA